MIYYHQLIIQMILFVIHCLLIHQIHQLYQVCSFSEIVNYFLSLDDNDLSPSSDVNSTAKSSQLLTTPNSLVTSSTMNLTNTTPIRSRTNSISSNSSILTN